MRTRREMRAGRDRRPRRRSRLRAAGYSVSPCAGFSSAHGFIHQSHDLVAETSTAKALGVAPDSADVEVVVDCTADCSSEGFGSGFLDQEAGLAWNDRFDGTTAPESNDRRATRLSLERNDAEILFACHQY